MTRPYARPTTFGQPARSTPQRRVVAETLRSANRLRRAFVAGAFLLGVFLLGETRSHDLLTVGGAGLIFAASLFPGYLWLRGPMRSLPTLPVFAASFAWTFAIPLVSDHPGVTAYRPAEHFYAAAVVSLFLAIATLLWVALRPTGSLAAPATPHLSSRAVALLLGGLFAKAALSAALSTGAVTWSPSQIGLTRGILIGISTVAAFVLPLLLGAGRLSRRAALLTKLAVSAAMLASMMDLLLVDALATALLALIGFSLARRQLAIGAIMMVLVPVVFLHSGKAHIREAYWRGERSGTAISLAEYPTVLVEWISYSARATARIEDDQIARSQPFSERASLVHLFLRANDMQREGLPALRGASYVVIPELLVPRFLMPGKVASHEGTYRLNLHYGLQTRESIRTTTIGWGLFNEAFGNFGILGTIALGLLVGAGCAAMERAMATRPITSPAYLFGVLVFAMAFQAELTAGVLVSSLFQSAVGIALYLFFARTDKHRPGLRSLAVS